MREPFIWMYKRIDSGACKIEYTRQKFDPSIVKEVPLYTQPQRRLSVSELAILLYGNPSAEVSHQFVQFARDIEDAHNIGEKHDNV